MVSKREIRDLFRKKCNYEISDKLLCEIIKFMDEHLNQMLDEILIEFGKVNKIRSRAGLRNYKRISLSNLSRNVFIFRQRDRPDEIGYYLNRNGKQLSYLNAGEAQ